MNRKIKIISGDITIAAIVYDSPTADAVWEALPLSGRANTWGDEIYFSVPVEVALDDTASENVSKGDLAYWPSGPAFCVFFGPTPISSGGEIKPASAVNVFGKVSGDTTVLKNIADGSDITVIKAEA